MKLRHLSAIVSFAALVLTPAIASSGELKVGGIAFEYGDPLTAKDPPRAMTQGGVVIPAGDAGASVDANFYYFGPDQGGSIEANVARWIGQFEGEPESEKEEIEKGDHKVVILTVKGTYLDGRPFGPKTPKKDYALLGAIIEGGDAPIFVKLYGPEKDVLAAKAAFKALVLSPFGKE